jgi:3',5'-cyclic-AMP phosphodiesterase
MLLAQISDSHLIADEHGELYGVPTSRTFRRVVDHVASQSLRPDLILLSGDLSDDGSAASYERIHDWMTETGIPYMWIPGNHDSLSMMMRILPAVASRDLVEGWRLVLVNSKIPDDHRHDGEVSADDLKKLDRELAASPLRTIIAVHHHPIPVRSRWIDETYPLRNREAFRSVVDRHEHVTLVLFGHVHQEVDRTEGGVRYLGAPATSQQFVPCRETLESDEVPPGYRLIWLESNGGLETRVIRCPEGR